MTRKSSGAVDHYQDPDLRVLGLRIWFTNREFPHSDDYWDGNWLMTHAIYQHGTSRVEARGPFVHLGDIVQFRRALTTLKANLNGTAKLDPVEPNLCVTLTGNGRGQIDVDIELTPDHMLEQHTFRDSFDQTFLDGLISDCAVVLERFPVKRPEELPPAEG